MTKLPAKNGKPAITIEYHPSFCYPLHFMQRFTPELSPRLDRERNEYKQKNRATQEQQQAELETIISQQKGHIQELQRQYISALNPSASLTPPPVPEQVQLSPSHATVSSAIPGGKE